MKHIFTTLFAFAVLFTDAQTGCPGCVIDMSCTGNAPVLCPATLPDGTVGVPYDQDITFFIPQTFDYSGVSVTILNIVINGISGYPPGLMWQCNSPNFTYTVTSSAGERGCVKICGTPQLPGSYTVTVTVTATVNTPIGQQIQQQQFALPMNINPPAGGCYLFSASSSLACGELCDTFHATFAAQSPYQSSYAWTFGNGQTSTLQDPPVICYNTPGDYNVELTVTNWKFVIDSITAQTSGNWWCGDIEEIELFGACQGSPDLIGTLSSGNASMQTPEYTDNTSAHWYNLNFELENFAFSISFIDNDAVSTDDAGGASTLVFTGAGMYPYTTSSPFGGGVSGFIYVHSEIDTSFTCNDTVTVLPLPPVANFQIIPDSTVCASDSVILSVYTGPYTYSWYKNDTSLIPFQSGNTFVVNRKPFLATDTIFTIHVVIQDTTTGCNITSETVTIHQKPPIPPNYLTQGAYVLPSNPGTINAQGTIYTYQWLFNGLPISGATGNTYSPLIDGLYSVIFTNAAGCSDTSNTINFVKPGVNEVADFSNLLRVFPNPASSQLNVIFDMAQTKEAVVAIYNLSGQLVYSSNWTAGHASHETIDISNLANGSYYVLLHSSDAVARQKFSVVR